MNSFALYVIFFFDVSLDHLIIFIHSADEEDEDQMELIDNGGV